jgi:sodium-dependent phosphate transporter
MAVLHQYEWLVVVGSFAAFAFGWGTGSNDVANAFATSVGSKALTLKQAVIIAAIFEFAGALLLGRVNTNVIAGGIANINAFTQTPEIYAYGMVCALTIGFVWQGFASFMELNVSATHSIIGGIMGFGLVHAGKDGIVWAQRDPGAFPPYKGVVAIILSWFVSPILSGALAALIFFSIRMFILRRKNAYNLSFWILPFFVLFTVFVNMYFVFTKGAKKLLTSDDDSWTDGKAAWIAAVCAAGVFIFTAAVLMPLLKWWTNKKYDTEGKEIIAAIQDTEKGDGGVEAAVEDDKKGNFLSRAKGAAMHGMNVDVHAAAVNDQKTADMHANAELFQPRVEYAFSYLQVFSACAVIFAHGAGEVGYMAGPLATIWDVYQYGTLKKTVKPPIWVILIGALGLVTGLATYGYNVTRAMGVKLAKLTPTRGFSAELATAGIITIAAQYGLPTSSSQCITGAIVGVGVLEGAKGVNWIVFLRQFASWVATLGIVMGLTAALFAQGVYAPSEIDSDAIISYESNINNLTGTILKNYNTTLYAFQAPSLAGDLPRLTTAQWEELNNTIASAAVVVKNNVNATKQGTATVDSTLGELYGALQILQNYTINALGQTDVVPGAALCANPAGATNAPCTAGLNLTGARLTEYEMMP